MLASLHYQQLAPAHEMSEKASVEYSFGCQAKLPPHSQQALALKALSAAASPTKYAQTQDPDAISDS
ncbi:hypothetical protein E4630_23335 [Aeromonas hydrophila]|nr:hypothetical protein E4625_23560 [Aeromonas hydrophila]QBX78242.1 hypothetical protein E4630_23335 [Aeromonas hydrophila]